MATWCGFCHSRCGLQLDFENDRAVGVHAAAATETDAGRICRRGRLMLEHLYNPDRLDYPLRRVGGRGEDRWERVGWSEALDEIAERLAVLRDRHGPRDRSL